MKKYNLVKGQLAEQKAQQFLQDKKYKIIHKNWRCKLGEIDIIAKDGAYLCFIEVKYRSSDSFGLPRESVNYSKKQKLIKLANVYVQQTKSIDKNIRFDVVEVDKNNINIIKNAFSLDS